MKPVIMVYVTAASLEEARSLSQHLLQKKLIACANYFPSTSLYVWEGKTVEHTEYVLICKTVESKFALVEKELLHLHSYAIPCILKIATQANGAYAQWVEHGL